MLKDGSNMTSCILMSSTSLSFQKLLFELSEYRAYIFLFSFFAMHTQLNTDIVLYSFLHCFLISNYQKEYISYKVGFRPQSLGFNIFFFFFFNEERAVSLWKTTKEKGRDQIRQHFKGIIAFAWQFWTYIVKWFLAWYMIFLYYILNIYQKN